MSSNLLKSFLAGTLLGVGLAMTGTGQAMAVTLQGTATVTADNHYGLFYGDRSGNSLNFVGRNELGRLGSQGGWNWSNAETWNFEVDSKDYLYMVVWDDKSVDEMWVGQFTFSNDSTLLSDANDWEFIISSNANPFSRPVPLAERDQGFLALSGDSFEGNVPKSGELGGEIQRANAADSWVDSLTRGYNVKSPDRPWGQISGISANAQFLNTTTSSSGRQGTAQNNNYTIFRTRNTIGKIIGVTEPVTVPEPNFMFGLLAFGAVSAGSFIKRKSKV
jgi:hypothetical protein